MSLRPILPNEVGALVELCAEHAEYEDAEFRHEGQEQRLAQALFSSPPRLFVWVVEIEGRLDGFAAASLEYSTWSARDFLHLDCMYLRASTRGQGWGSKLLAAVAAHGRRLGCVEMQWQTPSWNEKAIAFYDAKGGRSKPKLRYTLPLDPT